MARAAILRAVTLAVVAVARAGAAVHAIADDDALAHLPALKAGDIVELSAPVYHRAFIINGSGTREAPIVVRGVGAKRPVIDATGCKLTGTFPDPRACVQADGVHIVVEHLEMMNARNGDNGSGFRVTSDSDNPGDPVVLRDCVIHDCDMGVQGDGGAHLTIESCDIARCGTDKHAGASHNIYMQDLRWLTVRGSWVHDSTTGYNIKTRAHYVEVLYSLISDAAEGELDFVDSAATNRPDSNVVMIGNVVASKVRAKGANQERFIFFSGEGPGHQGVLYAYGNTFVAASPSIVFFTVGRKEAPVVAANDLFVGSANLAGGNVPFAGRGNWMTVLGNAPDGFLAGHGDAGVVNASGRDFHLTSSSPCRDAGADGLKYRDGAGAEHVAKPEWMFGTPAMLDRRGVDGRIDIGAFEFGGSLSGGKRRPAGLVGVP